MRHRWVRLAGVLGVGMIIGALGPAVAASAHVTVNPNSAPRGGYARIAFRVPTESDTVSTTKIQVFLDTTHPVASVATMPVPGWTATVTRSKLATPLTDDDGNQVTDAIGQITWTATSAASAIKPGQFNEFPVSLGPLPKTGSLVFKVLQTYSDGTVVRWIDLSTPGGPEPEHPAPVLNLTASTSTTTSSSPVATIVTGSSTSGGSSTGAITLGIIGVVLGLVGAVLGGAAYARTRQVPAKVS